MKFDNLLSKFLVDDLTGDRLEENFDFSSFIKAFSQHMWSKIKGAASCTWSVFKKISKPFLVNAYDTTFHPFVHHYSRTENAATGQSLWICGLSLHLTNKWEPTERVLCTFEWDIR